LELPTVTFKGTSITVLGGSIPLASSSGVASKLWVIRSVFTYVPLPT